MPRLVSLLVLCGLVLSLPATAHAYDLGKSGGSGAITGIAPGIKQLGFESVYLINADREGDNTSFRLAFVGGANFDVFLAKNVHLGVNASFFVRRSSVPGTTGTDLGGLFTAVIGYSAPVGGGLFIRPLIGGGGFVGERRARIDGVIGGGAVRGGVSLVFYANRHFKVHAGPEAVLSIGGYSPEDGSDDLLLISLESGFNVGITHVF